MHYVPEGKGKGYKGEREGSNNTSICFYFSISSRDRENQNVADTRLQVSCYINLGLRLGSRFGLKMLFVWP